MPRPVKMCPGCNRLLPLSAYRKYRGHGAGIDSRCKECVRGRERERMKAWRDANAEYDRAYHATNKDRINEKRRERRRQAAATA